MTGDWEVCAVRMPPVKQETNSGLEREDFCGTASYNGTKVKPLSSL